MERALQGAVGGVAVIGMLVVGVLFAIGFGAACIVGEFISHDAPTNDPTGLV